MPRQDAADEEVRRQLEAASVPGCDAATVGRVGAYLRAFHGGDLSGCYAPAARFRDGGGRVAVGWDAIGRAHAERRRSLGECEVVAVHLVAGPRSAGLEWILMFPDGRGEPGATVWHFDTNGLIVDQTDYARFLRPT